GRAALVCRYQAPGLRPSVRARVIGHGGEAQVWLPNRLGWTDEEGKHRCTLGGQPPLTQVLLEQFYPAVRTGQRPVPDLEDAYRALRLLRAAALSRAEGQQVMVQSE